MRYVKNNEYFIKYISQERKRIEKFKSIEFNCQNESQKEKCYVTLVNLYKNIICCMCSLNKVANEFINDVAEYIKYSNRIISILPESEKIDLLAIKYLFIDSNENNYNNLITKLKGLKQYKVYEELYKISQDNETGQKIAKFMNEKWYDMCSDFPWYDSHESNYDIYVGYWSFVASAIIKHNNIDSQNIKYIIRQIDNNR